MTEVGAKRILLAVDKSRQARRMADYLSEMLRPDAVEITLLNIFNRFPEAYWDFQPDHASGTGERLPAGRFGERNGREILEQVSDGFVAAGFAEARVRTLVRELRQGVARDIALEARGGYDLLVLGTRGESTLANLVFGSVTAKLMSSLTDKALCLVEGKPAYTRTLAALDGSDESLQAVLFWADLARPSWEITLFHVVRENGVPEPESDLGPTLREPSQVWVKDHLRSFNHFLETARTELSKRGFNEAQVSVKIVQGSASRAGAIVEEAAHGRYGNIILGRRGFSRVMEHAMGRVANKVVQLARDKAVWLIP
jgi:nucleotide-binding universal stress UspA family protein